jgi:RNA polymerase sigma-70 factor (sigma-E family)
VAEGPTADEAGFRRWVAVRSTPLRRKAYLLCGNWHTADDLLQETLIAVYASWPRVASSRNIDAYVNRILVNKYVDDRRRPWRRERPVDELPDTADERASSAFVEVEGRDSPLARALAALPVTQRSVLVLRHTDDLSVEEIAHQLDLPAGTVKSRLSRGSEAIRNDLERSLAIAPSTPEATGTTEGPR